jgi:hypothetical protein
MQDDMINGILLIYHHPLMKNAPMILEHVDAFTRYSRFQTWAINTEGGFPPGLRHFRFRIVLLHYSLFGYWPWLRLNKRFLRYLAESNGSYKIAFFQDEYHFCQSRFDFINQYNIDCVYTLLEPSYFKDVYRKYTRAKSLIYTIPGYVSHQLVEKGTKFFKHHEQRSIDIGYRSRPVMYYMGKGAREKMEIARVFLERGKKTGLKLDIGTQEKQRIYGDHWYKFLAECRAVLGVEAGVSVFDLEDNVRKDCEKLLADNPGLSFEDVSRKILDRWEGNIYYRTISTRHFEAAAFRVCQILFEGRYSGIMQPMVHYIPVKKDFSNFDEVIHLFRDPEVRLKLTENAYQDLIASGKYRYKTFIDSFDRHLLGEGVNPRIDAGETERVSKELAKWRIQSQLRAFFKMIRYYPYPGKAIITTPLKPLVERYRRHRQNRLSSHLQ